MEPWITVLVALIVAISTLSATFIQSWHSNWRFKLELGRAIDVDVRKRKWQVRSEPLLKLRAELANMATKLKMLVIHTRGQHYRSNITEEEKNKELERAVEDLKVNLENGNFLQALNLQYDAELLQMMDHIISSYSLLFTYALHYESLTRPSRNQKSKSWG